MRNGHLLAEGHPEAVMKQHSATVSNGYSLHGLCRHPRVLLFTSYYPLLQTLEQAFLRLCETSDQVGSNRGSSPQDGALDTSQSFESGRDESLPILGVGASTEDVHSGIKV